MSKSATLINNLTHGWVWWGWWGLGFLPIYRQQYYFRDPSSPEKIIVLSPVKQMSEPNHTQPPRDHRTEIPMVFFGWDARTHIPTTTQPRSKPNHAVQSTPAAPRLRAAAAPPRNGPRSGAAAHGHQRGTHVAAARRPRRRALAARGRRGEPRGAHAPAPPELTGELTRARRRVACVAAQHRATHARGAH